MEIVKFYKWMALALLMLGTMTSLATAGQVVTPDLRQWAHNAIQHEKQLETISKPHTIAVLYFQNLSGQSRLDPYQKGLTVMLISDLSRLGTFTVIERAELQALVEELGFGQTGLVDPVGAPKVGRLLQAENLIGGAFLEDPAKRMKIGADILKVHPSKTVALDKIAGDTAALLDIEKKLLHQIVAALKIELTPQQQSALKIPLSRYPAALLELFKGIDASDQGLYGKAAEHYSRALKTDPDLELAKQSLTELNTLGLLKNASRKRRMLRQMREQTSFSTTLNPPLPLSRIPPPAGVGTIQRRVDQSPTGPPMLDGPIDATSRTGDSQPTSDTSTTAH
jgi:TolB-like protein